MILCGTTVTNRAKRCLPGSSRRWAQCVYFNLPIVNVVDAELPT